MSETNIILSLDAGCGSTFNAVARRKVAGHKAIMNDALNDLKSAALVLFSGGQDSATCLAWALEGFDHVETVGFDYGQRHRVELDRREVIRNQLRSEFPAWSTRLRDDHTLDLKTLGAVSETALTRETEIAFGAEGLPTTFV